MAASHISSLPIEVLQYVMYESGVLEPKDVVAFALTNTDMYRKVFGVLGQENTFDRNQHRALGGVLLCALRGWWDAALLAIRRGYGDVEEEVGESVFALGRWIHHTPFTLACEGGEAKVVEVLLGKEGVKPSGVGFALACEGGAVDVVAALMDDRVNPAVGNDHGFRLAARNGHTEIVQLLLGDDRVNPGARNDVAINYAAKNGHAEIVKLLLGHDRALDRVKPAARNGAAEAPAVRNGHPEMVSSQSEHESE